MGDDRWQTFTDQASADGWARSSSGSEAWITWSVVERGKTAYRAARKGLYSLLTARKESQTEVRLFTPRCGALDCNKVMVDVMVANAAKLEQEMAIKASQNGLGGVLVPPA